MEGEKAVGGGSVPEDLLSAKGRRDIFLGSALELISFGSEERGTVGNGEDSGWWRRGVVMKQSDVWGFQLCLNTEVSCMA